MSILAGRACAATIEPQVQMTRESEDAMTEMSQEVPGVTVNGVPVTYATLDLTNKPLPLHERLRPGNTELRMTGVCLDLPREASEGLPAAVKYSHPDIAINARLIVGVRRLLPDKPETFYSGTVIECGGDAHGMRFAMSK